MESIAPFLIEKSIGPAKELLLGSEAEREIEGCITRSVSRVLEPYRDDTDLQQHLDGVLTTFLRRGGIELFFVPDAADNPNEDLLRTRFFELGGDPDTIPGGFDHLARSTAAAFTDELANAAQRHGSPLFNLVNVKRTEELHSKLNLLQRTVDALDQDTRAGLEHIGSDLDGLRRARRRSERVPDAKALLNGPIRALRLQGQLNAADRFDDRLQAAESYGEIAANLSAAGYEFHARLIHQKRAEALADGGSIEDAFHVWLEQAAAELESGRLWISPALAHGIDTQRDEMPPAFKARADALQAREGWYEQPAVSIRILKRSLDVLTSAHDAGAAEVAVWLGEALAVDGTVDNLNIEALVTPFGDLADQGNGPASVRLRLLVAEATGDWDVLLEDVSTDTLSAEDTGLVGCRYGRWLALEGRADEAITAYREAVDPLAEADLLGDTAGALRSIAMVQERYIGLSEWESITQTLELAKLASSEPSRFRRSNNPRTASVEALHKASERNHGALPDALRSARRYLWEARISGHLSAEKDARRLLGDVLAAAGKADGALHNYVLGGEDKKASSLAERAQLLDVRPFLDSRTPWIVGTALAVLAAQGDYWPPEMVERIAPRLIELTAAMRQSHTRPEVYVQAWAALASVTAQLPDSLIDQVLKRIDPLVEREEHTYRRMDQSLLDILGQIHAFKPSIRSQASGLITRCLKDQSLTQRLEQFLTRAVKEDAVIREAVEARASAGDLVAKTVLTAARIRHADLHTEAQGLFDQVMAYETGEKRTEMVVTDRYWRAAVLSTELTPKEQASLTVHLLEIASDELSPEPHRVAAVEALAECADKVDDSLRKHAFDTLMSLVDAQPSDHPIDQQLRNSLDPLSRFSFNTGMSLSREACETAGEFVRTVEEAHQLVSKAMSMVRNSDEPTKASACRAILAIDPSLRPQLPLPSLAEHPLPLMRKFALALWIESPSADSSLAVRFASDPDRNLREQLANSIPQLAKRDENLARRVASLLNRDPSAVIRAVAARNSEIL